MGCKEVAQGEVLGRDAVASDDASHRQRQESEKLGVLMR